MHLETFLVIVRPEPDDVFQFEPHDGGSLGVGQHEVALIGIGASSARDPRGELAFVVFAVVGGVGGAVGKIDVFSRDVLVSAVPAGFAGRDEGAASGVYDDDPFLGRGADVDVDMV